MKRRNFLSAAIGGAASLFGLSLFPRTGETQKKTTVPPSNRVFRFGYFFRDEKGRALNDEQVADGHEIYGAGTISGISDLDSLSYTHVSCMNHMFEIKPTDTWFFDHFHTLDKWFTAKVHVTIKVIKSRRIIEITYRGTLEQVWSKNAPVW